MKPIITSLLDQDLYKFSMGAAVFQMYPRAWAAYTFILRSIVEWPEGFAIELQRQLVCLRELKFADDEIKFMSEKCPYIPSTYMEWLRSYQFKPSEVGIELDGRGEFEGLTIRAPWYRAILWEVVLMAIISELYFTMRGSVLDTRRSITVSSFKARELAVNGVYFAEGGTRRRFSFENQCNVIGQMAGTHVDFFVGTSNVFFAKKFGLQPVGTQAHEWFMFHAAKHGFQMANEMALEKWIDMYQGDLGIALSDTLTTDVFFRAFGKKYAKIFDGVRHDSGCPFGFTDKMIARYKGLGIDPMSKKIVFSDGLDVDKAINLSVYCEGKIGSSVLIGTHFTNDVGVTPLNMVIKMSEVDINGTGNWIPTIKLSDSPGKHTGNIRMIESCKMQLGIE